MTEPEPMQQRNEPTTTITTPSVAAPRPLTPREDKISAANKAAELRAKLIAMRPSSLTPGREKMETAKASATVKNEAANKDTPPAPLERKESITDIDGLLAEARSAAEAKAKQHNGDRAGGTERPANAPKPRDPRPEPKATVHAIVKPPVADKKEESGNKVNTPQRQRRIVDSPELGEIREDESTVPPIPKNLKPINEGQKRAEEKKPIAASNVKTATSKDRNTQNTENTTTARITHPPPPRPAVPLPSPIERRGSLAPEKPRQPSKSVNAAEDRPDLINKRSKPQTWNETEKPAEQRALRHNQSQPQTPTALGSPSLIQTQAQTRPQSQIQCQPQVQSETKPQAQPQVPSQAQTKSPTKTQAPVQAPSQSQLQTQSTPKINSSSPQAERGTIQRPKPDAPDRVQPESEKRVGVAAAHSNYFDDLDEWLEITGYHDRVYRKSALKRHRALTELEIQRAQIEKEAEMELQSNTYLPAQSVRPADYLRSSSVLAMPPPRIPPPSAARASIDMSSPVQSHGDSVPQTPATVAVVGSKRPSSASANGQERAEKLIRVDSVGRAARKDEPAEKTSAKKVADPEPAPPPR